LVIDEIVQHFVYSEAVGLDAFAHFFLQPSRSARTSACVPYLWPKSQCVKALVLRRHGGHYATMQLPATKR
ncbi:MAG TPA: hypothetical protein QF853_05000, partial [Alphaproteobacteria bacterium]|nr:hypothetical protein [Alphaproteobacteria bacterium]